MCLARTAKHQMSADIRCLLHQYIISHLLKSPLDHYARYKRKGGSTHWLIAGRNPRHNAHSTQRTIHCTLLTAHYTLLTANYTLHTAHQTLYTTYCTLHSAHCTLGTLICAWHTGDCMTVEGGALLIGVLGDLGGIFTSQSLLSFHTTHCTPG